MTEIDLTGVNPALLEQSYDHQQMVDWAQSYNAYQRLASKHLPEVLAPLRAVIAETGLVPEWAGVDLLRGLVFWLTRAAANREAPEDVLHEPEFIVVTNALLTRLPSHSRYRPPVGSTSTTPSPQAAAPDPAHPLPR